MKKNFNYRTIAFSSVLMGITIVLVLIEGFMPKFLTGGTIEIHFFPVIIVALILSLPVSIVFAIITSLLQILLVPVGSGWLISPVQVILDYNLPYLTPSIIIGISKLFFWKQDFLNKFHDWTKFKKTIYLQTVILLIFLINYIFHVISGAIYFAPANRTWTNWKAWSNSLVLNSYYMTATYLIFSVGFSFPIVFIVDYYFLQHRKI